MNLSSWTVRSLLLTALLSGLATPASAALVLSIGPEFTSITQPALGATSEITLTVFMRAQTGTESVVGYTLPIDISPPTRTNLPPGMTITGATALTIFSNPPFAGNFTNPGEGDLVATAGFPGGTSVSFDTNPSPLFNFNVSIDSSVAPGDYTVDFFRGVLLSVDRNLTATFDPPAVIRIAAVPEPSTLGLLGCFVVPLVLRRSRRSS